MRAGYRAKRDVVLPALEAAGFRHAGGDATFFLWLDAGEDAEAAAARLLERGLVLAPGSFFGAGGERFLRLALVPDARGVPAGGGVARSARLLVGVQGLVEAAPRAAARQRLDGARLRVAPEQQVVGA